MKRRLNKTQFLVLVCLALIAHLTSYNKALKSNNTLTNRLTGTLNIVDGFINRVNVNDVPNANPAIDTARKRVLTPGLKFQVTGGPHHYSGRNMEKAHTHLNINENEWRASMNYFKKLLGKYEVPAKE